MNSEKSSFLQRHSVPKNGKIAIFGAGAYGKNLHNMLKLSKIKTDVFLDNNPIKWGHTVIDGVTCYKPENMLVAVDKTLVIVAVKTAQKTIKNE